VVEVEAAVSKVATRMTPPRAGEEF
jgi:hypothetical protein